MSSSSTADFLHAADAVLGTDGTAHLHYQLMDGTVDLLPTVEEDLAITIFRL
jgi:hypothetical protein